MKFIFGTDRGMAVLLFVASTITLVVLVIWELRQEFTSSERSLLDLFLAVLVGAIGWSLANLRTATSIDTKYELLSRSAIRNSFAVFAGVSRTQDTVERVGEKLANEISDPVAKSRVEDAIQLIFVQLEETRLSAFEILDDWKEFGTTYESYVDNLRQRESRTVPVQHAPSRSEDPAAESSAPAQDVAPKRFTTRVPGFAAERRPYGDYVVLAKKAYTAGNPEEAVDLMDRAIEDLHRSGGTPQPRLQEIRDEMAAGTYTPTATWIEVSEEIRQGHTREALELLGRVKAANVYWEAKKVLLTGALQCCLGDRGAPARALDELETVRDKVLFPGSVEVATAECMLVAAMNSDMSDGFRRIEELQRAGRAAGGEAFEWRTPSYLSDLSRLLVAHDLLTRADWQRLADVVQASAQAPSASAPSMAGGGESQGLD